MSGISLPARLWVILSGFFFVNCGANMVIPFFGIYLTQYMNLNAAQAGFVLTVTVGTPRALALFGGSFSDRFGIRRSMLLGLSILIVSSIGYAFSHSLWLFVLYAFISGIGYSLFTPAGKAAVSAYATEQTRVMAFSFRNMAVNLGVAVGPIVGMLITIQAMSITFLLTSAVYLVFMILLLRFLPQNPKESSAASTSKSLYKNLLFVFRDQRLLLFSLLIITFYIMLAQFTLVLPLYAVDRFQAQDHVGLIFTGNALLMIGLQFPALAFISRYLSSVQTAFLGVVVTIIGIGSAGFADHFVFLVCVTLVIFTLGQLLIMPSIDAVVAEYAPAGFGASYQGFSGLAGAVGGIIGNMSGGILYSWARNHDGLTQVWHMYFILGIMICGLYLIFHRMVHKGVE
ncbi:MFS transporter [Paenibacillus sp. SI8]|uniref:MFS transporter n=1 Tax=unclassified Paenibacillus TaxID=185978 RepID=UPI00346741AB